MMGYISIEQRNYDQAMNLADKIISIVPNLVNGYILKSTLIIDLKQKHQIDLAIEISERIIQIDPELPIGYVNKALAYGIKDDVNKGISLLKSMTSKFKDAPEISWALSKLYLMKKNTSPNDIDSAERYFYKSIDGYNLSADQRAEVIRQFKIEVAPKKAYNTAKAVGRKVINTVQDENFQKEIRNIFSIPKGLKILIGIWIISVVTILIYIIIISIIK
jgi:tetratricopeptide (TPR) repeat protein